MNGTLSTVLTPTLARRLKNDLMNSPVPPRHLCHLINVGTDPILDALEDNYFDDQLAEGVSCFKYLEGDYGSGKSQFVHCLAARAKTKGIATAVVDVGQECPFNSPAAIVRSVMASLLPPGDPEEAEGQGIEVLVQTWVRGRLRQLGLVPGDAVPDAARPELERPFEAGWFGAPDSQMGAGLCAMGRRVVAHECGAIATTADAELVSWVRGDNLRSVHLKRTYGLHEPTNDTNAFQRLKTVVAFLRQRLAFKGFFIAFDEGTRTNTFRRGSVKQKQAIENMLTMINQNAHGQFGGVMFLYAATPEFRTDVIQNTYTALRDRIGSIAFVPGQPMTPLIRLEDVNSDENLVQLGERLLQVFALAEGRTWNLELQRTNMQTLIEAEKRQIGAVSAMPPRYFVFHWCRLLAHQARQEVHLSRDHALQFVEQNVLPENGR